MQQPPIPPLSELTDPSPPPAQSEQLADLFGGRVLAWVGGLAVLLGIVFLLAIAVSRGWIDASARTALAALGSSALLAVGIRLRERRGPSDAALAATAAGIAGLFATITVATQVYELLPSVHGSVAAVLLGGLATMLAVRWSSRGVAALGILGAIAAPLLTGAPLDGGTVAILFAALAAAVGVLLWQRWDWLALAAFLIATPQWIAFLGDRPSLAAALTTLIAFGALGVAAAVGHDLRVGAQRLRLQPAFLLTLNALTLALAGWFALRSLGDPTTAKLWLAGLALAHLAVGPAAPRLARVSRELGLLSFSLGVVLADVAFALMTHGAVRSIGWTVTSVVFAALLRRTAVASRDEVYATTGLGGHVALALGTMLTVDDPFSVLATGGTPSGAATASIAALAAGCFVSSHLAGERRFEWRLLLDSVGLLAVAFLTALTLDGAPLVLALAGEVGVLATIARRRGDVVAGWGALAFLTLAGGYALVHEAPPASLVTGLADPFKALQALGAVAVAALLASDRLSSLHRTMRLVLRSVAALALLHLASGLVVTPFESGNAVDAPLLGAHQQGQMALSVFWALVGVATLVVGLRRDVHALRLAALALLGVSTVKVFVFDLATLTSVYRVVSFIGLGLLLLVGAFVWQRLRPHAPPTT